MVYSPVWQRTRNP